MQTHNSQSRITTSKTMRIGVMLIALILVLGGGVYWYRSAFMGPSVQGTALAPEISADLPKPALILVGKVFLVGDGDTITLDTDFGRYRIRLDSIDTPETEHGKWQPGQPYGQAARQHLRDLIMGKTLTAQCYEIDQFDREVCTLIMADGSSVNRAQVQDGYAWAYTAKQGAYLHDKAMPQIQRQAQQERKGLWQDANPVAPWVWRYERVLERRPMQAVT